MTKHIDENKSAPKLLIHVKKHQFNNAEFSIVIKIVYRMQLSESNLERKGNNFRRVPFSLDGSANHNASLHDLRMTRELWRDLRGPQ